ncbi:MAG: chemotaxis protein CheW [Myxococcota bacterium]
MSATQTGQWATFFLDQEQFAVPVEDVQEVLLSQPLTPVPLAPEEIVGLLNLRGAVMPAIDLRVQLGLGPRPESIDHKMLVLNTSEGLVSIVVDDIGDVFELAGEGWRPAPDTLVAQHRKAIFGIYPMDGQMILGLKTAAVCADEHESGTVKGAR